jgi:hypothetical protein
VDSTWPAPQYPAASAQLEATLRLLDAVEDLRREVDALHADLGRRRYGIPGAVVRVGAEAALLIAVAVVAGAGGFRPLLIVVLMAAALAAVVASEWLAARSAYVPPAFGFARARMAEADPPPEAALESDPWEPRFVAEAEALHP